MEALDQIRASIPDFEGYDDETSRAHSDELIRSYLGERLADFEYAHSAWLGGNRDAFNRLVLRCEFVDQEAFKPFEHASANDPRIPRLLDADLQVISLADRLPALDPAEVPAFVQRANELLDARDALMRGQ